MKDTKHFFDDQRRISAIAQLGKLGIDLPNGDTKADLMSYRNELRRGADKLSARVNEVFSKGGKDFKDLEESIETVSHMINRASILIDNMEIGSSINSGNGGQSSDELKLLAKGDRFASVAKDARPTNFGFGQFVKAMVTGTDRSEIRAALSEGTDSAGGYTVPNYLSAQLIDAMRAKTVVIQAGAMTVPLETQETTIARLASDPQASWRLENADVAESDPTFEAVTFTARSLACLVKVSRELLEDSLNLDSAMNNAFAQSLARSTDLAALFGSGTAPEPRGVFSTTNVNEVSMGTNGAQLTDWSKLLDALLELQMDNAADPTAMVMAPRTWRTIEGFVDTTGQPLRAPASIERIPRMTTTQVPVNQTQGTATNASPIIVGDFSQMMLGIRSGLRVEVLRERFADKMQYAFLAHLRFDVQIAQPKAFAKIVGIKP